MITLRAPSTLPTAKPSPSIAAPKLSWLSGRWNITHSTLPMWRKSRNVRITYAHITGTNPAHMDDTVTYQSLHSAKIKSVKGVDKPFSVPNTLAPSISAAGAEAGIETDVVVDVASLAYHWRGKRWLMIASSAWEILGHGQEEEEQEENGIEENGTEKNSWMVTYFAKTLFTPPGIDLYSRRGQLTAHTMHAIKRELAAMGGEMEKLVADLFPVKMDDDDDDDRSD